MLKSGVTKTGGRSAAVVTARNDEKTLCFRVDAGQSRDPRRVIGSDVRRVVDKDDIFRDAAHDQDVTHPLSGAGLIGYNDFRCDAMMVKCSTVKESTVIAAETHKHVGMNRGLRYRQAQREPLGDRGTDKYKLHKHAKREETSRKTVEANNRSDRPEGMSPYR